MTKPQTCQHRYVQAVVNGGWHCVSCDMPVAEFDRPAWAKFLVADETSPVPNRVERLGDNGFRAILSAVPAPSRRPNPADLTLRNLRALKKRLESLTLRVARLERRGKA